MKNLERKERFNIEVSELKCNEQLQKGNECYKTGKPCLYNCSGLCKESC